MASPPRQVQMDRLLQADGTVIELPYLDLAAVLDVDANSTIGSFPFDDPALSTPMNAYAQFKWFLRLLLIIVHRLGNMTISTYYLTEYVLQDMKDFTVIAATRLKDNMSDFEVKQELERIKGECRLFARTKWQLLLGLDLGTWDFIETSYKALSCSVGRERARMESMFLIGLKFYLMGNHSEDRMNNLENKIRNLPGYHTTEAAYREFLNYTKSPWKTLHWALSTQRYNIALIAAAYVDNRQLNCQEEGISIRRLIDEIQDQELMTEIEFDELVGVITEPPKEQLPIKLDLMGILTRFMDYLDRS